MRLLSKILSKREVVFTASLFLFLNSVFSQLYNFKKISVEQGLSAHGIYSMAEGPKGRLWIGLEGEGLNIYDGWEVTRFNSFNVGKNIRVVFRDSRNRMWIGSDYQGVSMIDREKLIKFNIDRGLKVNQVRGLTEDSEGNIYVATLGGGVSVINNEKVSDEIGSNEGLPSLRCKSILWTDSLLWVGTDNGLALIQNDEVVKVYNTENGLPSNKILSIKKGVAGGVWVGTQKGIAFVENKVALTFNVDDGLLDDRIKDLLPISKNEVWIGTRAGLGKLKVGDPKKGKLTVKWFNDQNGLSNNRIRCLYKDASKALWIGTYFGGVNRFFNESFSMYNKSSGLLDNVITAVSWNSSDSSLWMGSHENGVDVWGKNGLKSINKQIGLSENQITSIAHINDSLSLIATNEGLNLIKNFEVERVWDSYDGLFEGNYITSICTNKQYSVGLTNQDELFVIKNDSNGVELDSLNTKTVNEIIKSYVHSVSNIGDSFWIGTDSLLYELIFTNGLVKVQSTLPISGVLKLVEGEGYKVGFNSGSKIFKIDSNSIVWEKQYKKSDEVKFVIKDTVSSFWFGLKGRIIHVEFKEGVVNTKSFSFSEGFMGESALRSAVSQDETGDVYVGTIRGMLKFDPGGYVGIERDLEVYFENILSDNSEFDWSKYSDTIINGVPQGLTLPHRMNHLTFDYKAYHLKSPKEVLYKLELFGEQETVFETTNVSEEFHDLLPGAYELKIYAKTQWGDWSENPMIFEFEIKPPFWMTKAFQVSVGLLLLGFLFVLYKLRTRKLEREKRKLEMLVEERTKDLNDEKQKSEKLLLNILPVEVANELKVNGFAKTRKYEKASVLFTDFKGFTKMSSEISAEKLVKKLDEIFVAFDDVIGRNDLEKIKTIGDAYMCASGIPDGNPNQVKNIVLAGLQLVEVMELFNKKQKENGEPEWDVRVGIHTGELIAGVVGKKKFAYDVWGDTVNIASRMESNSEPGRVNISKATYDEVQLYFNCENRGKISAKNRGELDMYFVESLKEDYQKQNSKVMANQNFYSNIKA